MSEKFVGLYVTFDKEVTEEYIETIRPLIGSIKGVCDVRAKVGDGDHWCARAQAMNEMRGEIMALMKKWYGLNDK